MEGEPCNYVIIDIYRPKCNDSRELLNTEEVKLKKEEHGIREVQCVEIGNEMQEGVLVKICTQEEINSESDALTVLRRVYEEMGLNLEDGITCVSEV